MLNVIRCCILPLEYKYNSEDDDPNDIEINEESIILMNFKSFEDKPSIKIMLNSPKLG